MILKKLEFDLTVCKLSSEKDLDLKKSFYFIGRTADELSLVCRTEDTPAAVTAREDGWKGFFIRGPLDFSLIGILAKIAGILAEAGISIFAVSTYDTDYILVRANQFDKAVTVLSNKGYQFQQ